MSERAQALEHLQRLARDIGDVRDVAGRRSDPPREHQQMLARLGQWRGGILTVIDILQAPPVGVSPQPPDMLAVLRDLEWIGMNDGRGVTHIMCPACSALKSRGSGHNPYCGLAAVLAATKAGGVSPQPVQRFDLVSVNFAYTSDHEMERADDGEWVRFDDVFPLASPSPVEPKPPVHNDLCSWCLTQADHVAASEECYERNSERGRSVPKPPVEPTPEPPAIEGVYMDRSIRDFQRACSVHITEEQRKVSPDTALIALLCDAVRCSRELAEKATALKKAVEPAPPTPVPCVWRVTGGALGNWVAPSCIAESIPAPWGTERATACHLCGKPMEISQ